MKYNLYYGTVDGPLKLKYRVTKECSNDENAKNSAFEEARTMYYKNEGKYGLPGYVKIQQESDITGISIFKLYEEHIKDLMRWYAIPTTLDTIDNKNIILI